MVYLYDACDQISDFCHQQLLRKMQRKISWTDGRMEGRTDRGKTVYPPPPLGSGGINIHYSLKGQQSPNIENQTTLICQLTFLSRFFGDY